MSVTVDVNVLIYAANVSSPDHTRALALLTKLASGPDIVHFFWPVLLGFRRIATHPRVLPAPLSAEEADRNIAALIAPAHVRTPSEGDAFWSFFTRVAGHDVGNAVSDAHIAALMREHGVNTIYTRDRDFRRFDGISAVNPFG